MKSKGFTLIELIVVIAIIGLVSSIVTSQLGESKKQARDAQRMSDLRQIKNALELFYLDHGYYPASDCGWDCNGYRYSWNNGWTTLQTDLAPYIKELPRDPLRGTCGPWTDGCYSYAYGNVGRNSNRHQYDLTTQLEYQSSPYRCGSKGYRFYFDNRPWCTAFGGEYSNFVYEASS